MSNHITITRSEYKKLKDFYDSAKNASHVSLMYHNGKVHKELRITQELKDIFLKDLEYIHNNHSESINKIKKMNIFQFLKWKKR